MTDPWKIAQENQGLIKSYLSKNRWIIDKSHTLEYEDYWQIGLIALEKASKTYCADKGVFSSYAMQMIEWDIYAEYFKHGFPVLRVPQKKYKLIKDMDLSAMSFSQSFTFNVLNKVDDPKENEMTFVKPSKYCDIGEYVSCPALSDEEKRILVYLYVDGLSRKEISVKTGVKYSNLRRKIGEMLKKLRKFIKN